MCLAQYWPPATPLLTAQTAGSVHAGASQSEANSILRSLFLLRLRGTSMLSGGWPSILIGLILADEMYDTD